MFDDGGGGGGGGGVDKIDTIIKPWDGLLALNRPEKSARTSPSTGSL